MGDDYEVVTIMGHKKGFRNTEELIEKGFKVLRLWERDIKIMDINDFKEKLLGANRW